MLELYIIAFSNWFYLKFLIFKILFTYTKTFLLLKNIYLDEDCKKSWFNKKKFLI